MLHYHIYFRKTKKYPKSFLEFIGTYNYRNYNNALKYLSASPGSKTPARTSLKILFVVAYFMKGYFLWTAFRRGQPSVYEV